MEPLDSGVKQPEAAGAIAWILYNAYLETGEDRYRIGAEWCHGIFEQLGFKSIL